MALFDFVIQREVVTRYEKKKPVEQVRLLILYKNETQAIFYRDNYLSDEETFEAAKLYVKTYGYLAKWYRLIRKQGGIKWNADGTSNRPDWKPEMMVENPSFFYDEGK